MLRSLASAGASLARRTNHATDPFPDIVAPWIWWRAYIRFIPLKTIREREAFRAVFGQAPTGSFRARARPK
jgi:hypothetical protein